MSFITWIKGLRIFKSLRTVKNIETVGEVAKASKVAKFIKELPIIRIAAGSAVGVVIIESWHKAVSGISETFGTSEGVSSILLGCVAAVAIAVVVSAIFNFTRRRNGGDQ